MPKRHPRTKNPSETLTSETDPAIRSHQPEEVLPEADDSVGTEVPQEDDVSCEVAGEPRQAEDSEYSDEAEEGENESSHAGWAHESSHPAAADHLPDEMPPDGARQPASSDVLRSVARRIGVRTIVQFKVGPDESWRETVDVFTVSRTGAALWLSRPCPVGRIVNLVMDMPGVLRVYDHSEPAYAVAGVVQNCAESREGGNPTYHVGVAFIRKQLPESFRTDPTTTYRINGVDEDGLWTVVAIGSGFRERDHARYWAEIPMSITYRNEIEKKIERVIVRTRDISRRGMAFWGPLSVAVGEKIKVTSKDHNFFSTATVKNRTDDPVEVTKALIHVQFDDEFPVDTLPGVDPKSGIGPK